MMHLFCTCKQIVLGEFNRCDEIGIEKACEVVDRV